jgi:hypothetical protein
MPKMPTSSGSVSGGKHPMSDPEMEKMMGSKKGGKKK